jgi:gamma-glutamyltranspeptidase/glutathione hydrolase
MSAPLVADSYSSRIRPVLAGSRGAIAAAHPLATAAGQEILCDGGSAVDAVVAAQAVLSVVSPDACGLGGDGFFLVRTSDGTTTAINGAGASPRGFAGPASDGGASVTTPGIVDAWDQMTERWGRLPLHRILAPAVRLARGGMLVTPGLARAVEAQRNRLVRGGAADWSLVAAEPGGRVVQLELANLLDRIAKERAAAFYFGAMADAVADAVARNGGTLDRADLAAHHTVFAHPVEIAWRGMRVMVQPPQSQGILLAMALKAMDERPAGSDADHAGVELTEAAFRCRDRVAEGASLLDEPLGFDPERAGRRGGPRAYLHTAGVAAADRHGMTVSSLASVFDDFGSGVFVPQGGFVLNNRCGGFTAGLNEPAPAKRPVHTLAPVLLETPAGPIGLSTPGADGQVQTLLQVLTAVFERGDDLATAIARPRWRSEDGTLLMESDHPLQEGLRGRGHRVEPMPPGHMKFGSVVAAGVIDGAPVAVSDWRREAWSGVA